MPKLDTDKLISQAGYSRRYGITRQKVQYMIKNHELDTIEIRGGLVLVVEHEYKKIV